MRFTRWKKWDTRSSSASMKALTGYRTGATPSASRLIRRPANAWARATAETAASRSVIDARATQPFLLIGIKNVRRHFPRAVVFPPGHHVFAGNVHLVSLRVVQFQVERANFPGHIAGSRN